MGIFDKTTNAISNAYNRYQQRRQTKQQSRQQPPANLPTQPNPSGMTFSPTIVVQTGKQTDIITIVFIVVAYLIWMFDMSSSYGGAYKGYKFTSLLILNTNWVAVATSGIVSIFLVYSIATGLFEKRDMTFFISFLLLIVINSATSQFLFERSFSIPYLNLIVFLLFAIIAIYILHKEGYDFQGSEVFTYSLMVLTYSFFWINWGWTANIKAIIHLVYITFFCLIYLSNIQEVNKSSIYLFTSLFLIIDFFGYSYEFPIKLLSYFPYLLLITSWYCYKFTKSKFALGNMIFLSAIFVIAFVIYPQTSYAGTAEPLEKKETKEEVAGFWESVKQTFSNLGTRLSSKVESQLDYATGGLYRSQVEKNQFEPLGVYLDKVRAAQPRFYSDEPITLWSTIKSRTLSDPATVSFTCFRQGKDGSRIEIETKKKDSEPTDTLIPDKPFVVYSLEEKDVECTFRNKLEAGTNTITLSATYNFVTSAYQKSYFMDKDRMRAMIRENLEPLKEFGIKDTKPATIHTNGPVEVAIGIQTLTPVSDEADVVKPALGILLQNRGKITDKQGKALGEWKGKIKKINELVVVLPDGITIDNPEDCTPVKFEKIENIKDDCGTSCISICKNTCEEFSENLAKKAECSTDCNNPTTSDARKKCDDECAALFKADSGESNYEGYKLDIKDLETRHKDKYKDIDKNREFLCRITPIKKVLENTPITTKFIRVRARYDYLLENSVGVNVQQPPTLEEKQSPEFNKQIPDQKYSDIIFNRANNNELTLSGITLEAAKKYNVDYLFVKAIIQRESNWNPTKPGDSGDSFGLMQVSSSTAKSLGCASDFKTNPTSNVDCGVKYIANLIEIQKKKNLKHDLRNIAAAYNCGEKAMESDTKYGLLWNNPITCWSRDRKTNTRIYVDEVMKIYNNLVSQLKIDYISRVDIQTSPPTNPIVEYKDNKVIVKWTPSKSPNVKKYLVTRYYQGNSQYSTETEQTLFEDTPQVGLEYYYLIMAIDDAYNNYGSVETPRITIPNK